MKKISLAILLCFLAAPAMAQRVSDLPAAQLPLSGNELMSLDQNGTSKRVTTSSLMLGSLVLGIPNGGTGLSSVGPTGTCLQSNGLSLFYGSCGSGGGGGGTPGGTNGQLQYNNAGTFGGYTVGSGLSVVGGALVSTSTGAAAPAGVFPQIQVNGGMGNFAPLSTDTLASYAAHNTIMNGISYDPRESSYGAICGGYNTFAGNGTTTTFSYTIPFTGTTAVDNSNFFVFYEQTNGGGTATILNTTQFTVTGVNSGMGGTITLNSAVPSGSTLLIAHDDGPGLVAASTAQAFTGGYLSVPDGCTIYSSQTLGTQLAEGAQLIGQSFTPNYGEQGQGTKPIIRVIAPTGSPPAFGFNVTGKAQQFYEGFEITTVVPPQPTNNALGFLTVPVLIGSNGAGAGGGQSPGIVVQYVTFNSASVGYGAAVGSNSAYNFSVLRFNNFIDNTWGIYGPLSDQQIIGNDFSSNGLFAGAGNGGGMNIGPQQGAPGSSGAARVEYNRFEFNNEGVVVSSGSLVSFDNNQFDGNTFCGLDLSTFWQGINVTGGWMRGNGNGGSGGGFAGTLAAGHDADVCFNGGASNPGGYYQSNVSFYTNYGEGSVAPIGSAGATTPAYVYDFNTAGSQNNNIDIEGGSDLTQPGLLGSASVDHLIFRNGPPSNFRMDVQGQAIQGKVANGKLPSQARGLPANQWTSYYVFGDYDYTNPTFFPQMYQTILGHNMGTYATPFISSNPSANQFDCDIVDKEIFPNINPTLQNNPLVTWVPSGADPPFGGGSGSTFNAHLADSTLCVRAAFTWLGTPQKNKIYAQAATSTGFTNWSGYGGALGKTTTTQGSTLSWTITTDGNPIDINYELQATATSTVSGGLFTAMVDSTTAAVNVPTGGSGQFTFPINATSQTPATLRIPNIAAGGHTVSLVVTSTSSASNVVTPLYVSSAPGYPNPTGNPGVYVAGQLQEGGGAFASSVSAFDSMIQTEAIKAFADGENVHFVPVRNNQCCNTSTDIVDASNSAYPFALSAVGQQHLADAMAGAIQPQKNPGQIVNPLDYGASCNSQFLTNNYLSSGQKSYAVTTTQGSSVITISNFNPQPGNATQSGGGGNVGQVITIFNGCNPGPTTYILSATTTSMTVGWPNGAGCSTTNGYALITGYPRNPNDPSTAEEDTNPIHNASVAASQSGGKVVLPPNCAVGQGKAGSRTPLTLAPGTLLEGNAGGTIYADHMNDLNNTPTKLFPATTFFPDDTQYAIRTNNYATSGFLQTRMANFMVAALGFPFFVSGYMGACIGDSGGSGLSNAQFVEDHLTFSECPVGTGVPLGENFAVNFTAQLTGTDLNVTALTPTVMANGEQIQWLAIGDQISGTGIPGGETITSVPAGIAGPVLSYGPWVGHYGVSISGTTTSEAMSKSAVFGALNFGSIFTQYSNNRIDINGDCSDCWTVGDIHSTQQTGWYLGPFRANPPGNAANRIQLGRFEENSSPFVCDGCSDTQLMDVQFQFNSYAALLVNGAKGITMTGGMLQDGGVLTGTSEILLSDTASNVNVTGVDMFSLTCCGGPLFKTQTGYTGNNISVSGGEANNFNPSDFTNGTPSSYKQDVAGWQQIDTSNTALSITSTGGVGIGIAAAQAGTSLDIESANPMVLPQGTTAQQPTTPIGGMFGLNQSTGNAQIYTSTWNQIFSAIPYAQSGMLLSNDATTPNSVIDISAGSRSSDDGLTNIYNPFPFTKTTASWAAGSGNGCLDSGSVGNNHWYCVYGMVKISATPAIQPNDYICTLCTNAAPTLPAGSWKKNIVGFFKTDGSAHILPFNAVPSSGGFTYYKSAGSTLDISTTSLGTTSTSDLYALDVPTNVVVQPILRASAANTTTAPASVYFSSVYNSDIAPTTTAPFSDATGYSLIVTSTSGTNSNTVVAPLLTSTTGTIRARASVAGTAVSVINDGIVYCAACNTSGIGNIFIDGKASSSVNALTTTTTNAVTLTTNGGSEEIIFISTAQNSAGSITGISDTASLTWAKRQSLFINGRFAEEWAAPAAGTLTNDVITATYNSGTTFSSVYAFSVAGQNVTTPFDPNGSLPANANLAFGTHASINTTISTNKARGLVFNVYSSLQSTCGTAPSPSFGFTKLFPDFSLNNVSFATAWTAISFEITGSTLSSATPSYTINSCATSVPIMLTDALQANGQP